MLLLAWSRYARLPQDGLFSAASFLTTGYLACALAVLAWRLRRPPERSALGELLARLDDSSLVDLGVRFGLAPGHVRSPERLRRELATQGEVRVETAWCELPAGEQP
ncbi:MAG: hypothetical protein JKY65_31085 [Planctomycetes bacterium]|nr:hypothetical protein [Planctomycetota bacterium]